MAGEDMTGWDDGTIWKIEEVVVKIAARLLPNQAMTRGKIVKSRGEREI